MRWQGGRRSSNIEDRRGMGVGRPLAFGGGAATIVIAFQELDQRFGAPGDFARAYVVAHEIGHHVQNLLGTSERVQAMRRQSPRDANTLSVLQELQADCFAGIWAHHAEQQRHILKPGDVEEGLKAASAVGDDTLQRRARGHVVPESFTHGSSEQRMDCFRRGLEQGTVEACDTFGAASRGQVPSP
jgi:predicted metalloprotease